MATTLTPDLIRQGVQIVTDARDQLQRAENGQIAPAEAQRRAPELVQQLDQLLEATGDAGLTGDLAAAVRNVRTVRDTLRQVRDLRIGDLGGEITRQAGQLRRNLDEALRLGRNAQAAPAAPAGGAAAGGATVANGETLAGVYQGKVVSVTIQTVNGTKIAVIS